MEQGKREFVREEVYRDPPHSTRVDVENDFKGPGVPSNRRKQTRGWQDTCSEPVKHSGRTLEAKQDNAATSGLAYKILSRVTSVVCYAWGSGSGRGFQESDAQVKTYESVTKHRTQKSTRGKSNLKERPAWK